MTIVNRLKHLSEVGTVIHCPEMTLLAADDEPPIVIGEGELRVLTETSFGYRVKPTFSKRLWRRSGAHSINACLHRGGRLGAPRLPYGEGRCPARALEQAKGRTEPSGHD
ncbi:hypothetical protein [Bosea lathyri]|uniref:hypothetical protein n=1 Tax=Bosea lathyri TaxID=1036778 RepID=UPI0011B08DBC|nr:hypothetical protein [Bosea lathyri]